MTAVEDFDGESEWGNGQANLLEAFRVIAHAPVVEAARSLQEQFNQIGRVPGLEAARHLQEHFGGIARLSIASTAVGSLQRAAVQMAAAPILDNFSQALRESMRAPALNALIGFQQAIASQIDFTALRELADRFRTALPTNLRDVEDLEAVAAITLEEGIPLAWVPNAALVDELLACPSAAERMNLLDARRDVVLDDCTEVLDGITDPWATAAQQAIDAMRGGYSAPAQSHAANLIDSIVLDIAGDRANVTKHAHAEVMRMPFLQAGQALVLRPLARALTRWYVTDATPPPDFFARHVVCHGVGRDGVFSERNALIGVMLATSLVLEFVDVEDAVVVA